MNSTLLAHLADLEEEVEVLNTFRHSDVVTIAEIEMARLRVDLMARQEELRRQEEVWFCDLDDHRANQEAFYQI